MHEVSEAAQQRGRSPRRGARADRARARVAVPRRRQRLCEGARRQGARRRRGGRRRGAVRRARGASARSRTGRATSRRSCGSANERLAIAERIGRADLQSGVLLELNDVYNARLETERAHEPLALAIELAGTSGSPTTRGWILRASGRQAAIEGRLGDAEAALDEARAIFTESGAALTLARTLNWLGVVLWEQARPPRRRGEPAGGDPPAQADPGPGNDGREPAPPGAGAARPGAPRGGGALRARGARDRRRRGRVVALDDAACARARPGGAGEGRRGRAAPAGGRGDPAADRVPAPSDRAARGARRVPPLARPRRRGGRGGGGAAPRRCQVEARTTADRRRGAGSPAPPRWLRRGRGST